MNFKEFRNRYQYDAEKDLLGDGGFGTVYRARDLLLDRWVALKVFSRHVPKQYDLISEIQRAISLNHPNICRYYGAEMLDGMDALGDSQTIQMGIMEYVECGTIDSFLRRNPQHLRKLVADVVRGLTYLHERHPAIIHRDLKPSNVLVGMEDGLPAAKITDFGISKQSGNSGTGLSVAGLGTYAYMAPEQINPARYGIEGKIQCNLDLWSFGAMLMELLTGQMPFGAGEREVSTGQIMESIVRGVSQELLDRFEEPYRSVLRVCMVQDASKRVRNARELIGVLDSGRSVIAPKQLADARQTIRKRRGYPIILYPRPGRTVGYLLVSLLFTIGGVWMGMSSTGSDQIVGYLCAGFFGLGVIVFLIMMFPGSTFLRLDEVGFTYRTLMREWSHTWQEIERFVAVDLGTTRANRTVGWNYLPQHRKSRFQGRLSQTLTGCDDALPQVTYGGKTALELAKLMNQCRQEAVALEEYAWESKQDHF